MWKEKSNLKTYILLVFIQVGIAVFSQQTPDLYFKHFNQQQNYLLGQNVNAMAYDANGFIWFGSDEGLFRFDGYELKPVYLKQLNSDNISEIQVLCLHIDNEKKIWVGTNNGTVVFDNERNTTIPIPIADKSDNTKMEYGYFSKFIYQDISNNIYLATREHLYLLNRNQQHFERFNPLETDDAKSYSGLVKDQNNTLWISTLNEGLYAINIEKNIFLHYDKDAVPSYRINSNAITSMVLDLNGDIWLSTFAGLHKISSETGTVISFKNDQNNPYSITNELITRLYFDAKQNLWICTEAGLYLYNRNRNNFIGYKNQIDNEASLSGDKIKNLMEDHQGNLWVFSLGGGMNYASLKNAGAFDSFTKTTSSSNGLSNNMVNAFAEDAAGNLWIGTDGGGLNYFDRKTSQFKHYTYNYAKGSSIQSNAITALYINSYNELWVGTFNGGLSKKNADGTFTTYKTHEQDTTTISSNNITGITEDSVGNLLVITLGGGLNVFHRKTGTFSNYKSNGNNPNSLSNNGGTTIIKGSDGQIWIGTYNGLSSWNQKDKSFKNFFSDPNDINSLCSNLVYAIFEDSKENVWIGTKNGMNLYNRNLGTITKPDYLSELNGKTIQSIFEDSENCIWILTNTDCFKFDPREKSTVIIDFSGHLSGYINRNASYKCKNGDIFIGTTKGFTIFNPTLYVEKSISNRVLLTDLKVFDQSVEAGDTLNKRIVLNTDISVAKQFTIFPDEKNFSIEFANLNFIAPEKVSYNYMLKGFDKKWRYTTSANRVASYTNIPAGNYTFLVKTASGSQDVTEVNIKVLTHWWLTFWAYLAYVLIFVALVLVYVKISLARIRLKKDLFLERMRSEKEMELNQLKTDFFTNITHELRTPLTLISGPVEILIEKYETNAFLQKHLEPIKKSADRLLLLINEMLELRRYESRNMELQASKSDIVAFVNQVAQSFNTQAAIHSIHYTAIQNTEPIEAWFDSSKLEKVIYNLLSNAFKYTPDGGSVQISVEKYEFLPESDFKTSENPESFTNDYLQITISDTGLGIPTKYLDKIFDSFFTITSSNKQSSGIGLALTKQIVLLHKGSIDVTSEENRGTNFRVKLPLGDIHLEPHQKNPFTFPDLIPDPKQKTHVRPVDTELSSEYKPTELPLILIVEDNAELRGFLKMELENNYQVIEASNGVKGLKLAFEHIPDLVISDVMMPEMDGIELCSRIKNDEKTNHIPVILLTARSTVEQKIEGIESGADSYIPKPFHPRHLEVRIRKLIETRKAIQDKFRSELLNNPVKTGLLSSSTSTLDDGFMQKAISIVESHIADPEFNVDVFSLEIGISYTQLYRKLKSVCGMTLSEFILSIRLKKACVLLTEGKLTMSEIGYETGFSSPSYFAKCFKEQYNVTPTEYCEKER